MSVYVAGERRGGVEEGEGVCVRGNREHDTGGGICY